jgi:uncharacterized membrane protein
MRIRWEFFAIIGAIVLCAWLRRHVQWPYEFETLFNGSDTSSALVWRHLVILAVLLAVIVYVVNLFRNR